MKIKETIYLCAKYPSCKRCPRNKRCEAEYQKENFKKKDKKCEANTIK